MPHATQHSFTSKHSSQLLIDVHILGNYPIPFPIAQLNNRLCLSTERSYYTSWLERIAQHMSLLVKLLLCSNAMSLGSTTEIQIGLQNLSLLLFHQAPLKYIFGYHSQVSRPNKIFFFSISSPSHCPSTKLTSCIRGLRHSILFFPSGLAAWQKGKQI